jgi:hypothetical protein
MRPSLVGQPGRGAACPNDHRTSAAVRISVATEPVGCIVVSTQDPKMEFWITSEIASFLSNDSMTLRTGFLAPRRNSKRMGICPADLPSVDAKMFTSLRAEIQAAHERERKHSSAQLSEGTGFRSGEPPVGDFSYLRPRVSLPKNRFGQENSPTEQQLNWRIAPTRVTPPSLSIGG